MYCFAFCLLSLFLPTTYSRSLQHTEPQTDVRNTKVFKSFETRFLNMMGMKKKPRTRRDAVVPQYMRDLYDSHVEDEHFITTNLAFRDFSTTANTVRSFYHTDVHDDDGVSNSSRKRVSLDVATVPTHEELVKADLRVYRSAAKYPNKYIINVYQILQPGVKRLLLDSRVIDVSSVAGWESYDILKAVEHWRQRPAENHGLEVDIMSENGNPIDISHLRFDKPEELEERLWPHHRPLLTVYTRDPNTHYHKERARRSLHRKGGRSNLCQRHDLKVNFTALGWQWIVHPQEYDGYYCKGKCVYPVAEHMNTTNHAIVQTLVHNVKKFRKTVPPACCIPTSLDALAMLYYDEKNVITLKKYEGMIVVGCGCR